jgi:hypothetical protein
MEEMEEALPSKEVIRVGMAQRVTGEHEVKLD